MTLSHSNKQRLRSISAFLRSAFILVNKPFVIWVFSTVSVAAVGWYYTSFQQCVQDANSYERTYTRLTAEIDNRREFLLESVATSNSIGDLADRIAQMPYIYREYKEATLRELNGELIFLSRHVQMHSSRTYAVEFIMAPRSSYYLFNEGRLPKAEEVDLDALKRFARSEIEKRSPKREGFKILASFKEFGVPQRNCSLANLIKRAKGDLYVPVVEIVSWEKTISSATKGKYTSLMGSE